MGAAHGGRLTDSDVQKRLLALADKLRSSDPHVRNDGLTNLRKATEALLRDVLARHSKEFDRRANLYELRKLAVKEQLLPHEQEIMVEAIAPITNRATHYDIETDLGLVQIPWTGLGSLVRWFYDEHVPGPSPPWLDEVLAPLETIDAEETFRRHRLALRRHVEEQLDWRSLFAPASVVPRTVRVRHGAGGEQTSLADLARRGCSATVFGPAGNGKSVALLQAAAELLDHGEPSSSSPEVLPVLVTARDLLSDQRLCHISLAERAGSRDLITAVALLLIDRLASPLSAWHAGAITVPAALARAVHEHNLRPVLLFDGVDELSWSPEGAHLKAALVEAIDWLQNVIPSLVGIVSSRPGDELLMDLLQWREYDLVPFTDDDVVKVVRGRGRPCEEPDVVTKAFHSHLGHNPLYLQLYCAAREHGDGGDGPPADRAKLLEFTAEKAVQARVVPQLLGGEMIRAAMRLLAAAMIRGEGPTDRYFLQEIAARAVALIGIVEGNGGDVVQTGEALVSAVEGILVRSRQGYHFPHDEFRDYWLADTCRTALEAGAAPPESALASLLRTPGALDLAARLMQGAPAPTVRRVLKEVVSRAEGAQEARSRPQETDAAAACSLYLLLFPRAAAEMDAAGRALPRLHAAGADLRRACLEGTILSGADLRGADLRGANLRRAVLDNADLRGSNLYGADLREAWLQNARIGGLPEENRPDEGRGSSDRPTIMVRAKLSESNWFNIRVTLSGFFHLWGATRFGSDDEWLFPTNTGELLHLRLSSDGDASAAFVPTDHQHDVMDIEWLEHRNLLITAGRDRTVRCHRLIRSDGALRQEPAGKLELSHDYPRRLIATPDGRNLFVGDRSGQVRIIPLAAEKDASVSALQIGDMHTSCAHTGPVMCLEGGTDPLTGEDVVFSAGYDGRVLRWEQGRDGRWQGQELADLERCVVGFRGTEHTIRALAMAPPLCPGVPSDLWVGVEGGQVFGLDPMLESQNPLPLFPDLAGRRVFALAFSHDGARVALGFHEGTVRVYGLTQGYREHGLELLHETCLEGADIIRSLRFCNQSRDLVIVTWDGRVAVWRQGERESPQTIFAAPDDWWHPERDRNQLRMGGNPEIKEVEGLSARLLAYLERLL
jgi:WD40 repeat protein